MSFLKNVKTAADLEQERRDALLQQLTNAVQAYLDAGAQERAYDNIFTLCTYATDPNPRFSAEGKAGVAWRGEVWETCNTILNDVLAGARPEPTKEEFIAELPALGWPV